MGKSCLYANFIKTKKPSDHAKYKKHSNILTRTKEVAKRKYYDNKIRYSTKSSKLIWQTVNEIVNLKENKKNLISNIKCEDGTLTSDTQKIAETLNNFFVNVGSKQHFPKIQHTFNKHSHIPVQKNSIFFKPFSTYEVKRHIKEMKTSKSVRPGDPPIKFIKIACDVFYLFLCRVSVDGLVTCNHLYFDSVYSVYAPVLTNIFNQCVNQFPKNLKEGCVIPIYKTGDRSDSGNHRPISLLSPFSKLFEKCILTQLNSFFTKHQLINPSQFGFQKNVSKEMAVSEIHNDLVRNLEGNIISSIFFDISKAFDSLNHDLLLEKLELYGIREPPLLLLKNFLTNRTQYTIINSHKSQVQQSSNQFFSAKPVTRRAKV